MPRLHKSLLPYHFVAYMDIGMILVHNEAFKVQGSGSRVPRQGSTTQGRIPYKCKYHISVTVPYTLQAPKH